MITKGYLKDLKDGTEFQLSIGGARLKAQQHMPEDLYRACIQEEGFSPDLIGKSVKIHGLTKVWFEGEDTPRRKKKGKGRGRGARK